MFKALKGKAAAALESASTTASEAGSKQVTDLTARVKSLEKELEKKDEALTKFPAKLKKAEETEQRLLGEMQRKDAELNRLNKQLEKYRAEGASASDALQEKMENMAKELEEALSKCNDMTKSQEQMAAKMAEMEDAMERQTDLANSSSSLQDQLDDSFKQMSIQEEKFKLRIVTLRKQLEVAERKVMNAKYLSESHEALAAESQMRQIASENKATECDRRLQRSLERYSSLEHDLQVDRLTKQCNTGRSVIKETEQNIRECYSDPLLKVPAGTAKRRQLKNLEEKLKKLRKQQKSQSEFLSQLTNIGDSNELLRTAANNSDVDTVKRLMKQGCSVNVPDSTGFSAFKYACGTGNMEIIRLMLDDADIQDEDGRMTSLILSAKNAHDGVVRLLVRRGASLESSDQIGRTALHTACDNGHRSTALELLDLGADVNAVDKQGNTSLHYCAQKNCAAIARLLLDRGIDTEKLNVDTLTAAKIAMEKKNQRVIEVLREHSKRVEAERLAGAVVTMDAGGFESVLDGISAGVMEGQGYAGNDQGGVGGRGSGISGGRRRSSSSFRSGGGPGGAGGGGGSTVAS